MQRTLAAAQLQDLLSTLAPAQPPMLPAMRLSATDARRPASDLSAFVCAFMQKVHIGAFGPYLPFPVNATSSLLRLQNLQCNSGRLFSFMHAVQIGEFGPYLPFQVNATSSLLLLQTLQCCAFRAP